MDQAQRVARLRCLFAFAIMFTLMLFLREDAFLSDPPPPSSNFEDPRVPALRAMADAFTVSAGGLLYPLNVSERVSGVWAHAGEASYGLLNPGFSPDITAAYLLVQKRAPADMAFAHARGDASLTLYARAPFPEVPSLQDVVGSIVLHDGPVDHSERTLEAQLKGVYASDAGSIILSGGALPGNVKIGPANSPSRRLAHTVGARSSASTSGSAADRDRCDILLALHMRPTGFDPNLAQHSAARLAAWQEAQATRRRQAEEVEHRQQQQQLLQLQQQQGWLGFPGFLPFGLFRPSARAAQPAAGGGPTLLAIKLLQDSLEAEEQGQALGGDNRGVPTTRVVLGDFDGDGDLEAGVVRGGGSFVEQQSREGTEVGVMSMASMLKGVLRFRGGGGSGRLLRAVEGEGLGLGDWERGWGRGEEAEEGLQDAAAQGADASGATAEESNALRRARRRGLGGGDPSPTPSPSGGKDHPSQAAAAWAAARNAYPGARYQPLFGYAVSPNCNFTLNVTAAALVHNPEVLLDKVSTVSLVLLAAGFAQIIVTTIQLIASHSQASAQRLSLLCIGMQAVQDSWMVLAAFALSAQLEPLAWVALVYFCLFMAFELRLLYSIWKARAPDGPEGGAGDARTLALVQFSLGTALLLGVVWLFGAWDLRLLLFLFSSYWAPQLVHTAQHDARHNLSPAYLIVTTMARSFLLLYMGLCPSSVLYLLTPPETRSDTLAAWTGGSARGALKAVGAFLGGVGPRPTWLLATDTSPSAASPSSAALYASFSTFAAACVLWQVALAGALYLQGKAGWGPRFFIPYVYLPKKYDYHRVVEVSSSSEEGGGEGGGRLVPKPLDTAPWARPSTVGAGGGGGWGGGKSLSRRRRKGSRCRGGGGWPPPPPPPHRGLVRPTVRVVGQGVQVPPPLL